MTTTTTTTTTTTDVFAQAGYSVSTKMVDRVDNQGEVCEECQTEGRYVDAAIYGVVLGEFANMYECRECCVWCVPSVIKLMDPTADVLVELGDSVAAVEFEELADDRMHSQDCECVHPDGE